jgi:hypothetical protein
LAELQKAIPALARKYHELLHSWFVDPKPAVQNLKQEHFMWQN